jgi:hypothetical protein
MFWKRSSDSADPGGAQLMPSVVLALDPVNRIHSLLKMFLNAHSGFNRDELQGYLDLYAFVINPPSEYLEKVEKLIKMVFENPKLLRYRLTIKSQA